MDQHTSDQLQVTTFFPRENGKEVLKLCVIDISRIFLEPYTLVSLKLTQSTTLIIKIPIQHIGSSLIGNIAYVYLLHSILQDKLDIDGRDVW